MIKPNFILSVTGKRIEFPVTNPTNICLEDIAWALSKAPRWCGHTDMPWTVAQHSILCTELARVEGGDISDEVLLQVLVHDATEAFLGDIPSPVKARLPDYRDMEHALDMTIHKALGVPYPDDESVEHTILKHYDRLALLLEARDLFDRFPRNPWDFGVGKWPEFQSIFGYMWMFSKTMPCQQEIFDGFYDYYANLEEKVAASKGPQGSKVPPRIRAQGVRVDVDRIKAH